MADSNATFRVSVVGNEIVVTWPGSFYSVTYYKPKDAGYCSRSAFLSMTIYDFRIELLCPYNVTCPAFFPFSTFFSSLSLSLLLIATNKLFDAMFANSHRSGLAIIILVFQQKYPLLAWAL